MTKPTVTQAQTAISYALFRKGPGVTNTLEYALQGIVYNSLVDVNAAYLSMINQVPGSVASLIRIGILQENAYSNKSMFGANPNVWLS